MNRGNFLKSLALGVGAIAIGKYIDIIPEYVPPTIDSLGFKTVVIDGFNIHYKELPLFTNKLRLMDKPLEPYGIWIDGKMYDYE